MAERIPASTTIRVAFAAFLASDHVSPATGKTIAITISKNGGAFGNPSGGATNATAIASGCYYADLSTTDTGTAGPLIVLGTEGTIDNVYAFYYVGPVMVDGTSPLTESYGTAGSGFTLAQALYEIAQNLGEFAIASTTITVKKRDHSTTAETYTLDSATDPITSRTRAT